jgi:hypothetical protein
MKFDLNEIAALLHIHEKATGHPKLKPIADAAMKHLETMAEETAKPEPIKIDEAETGDREPETEPAEDDAKQPGATIERKL